MHTHIIKIDLKHLVKLLLFNTFNIVAGRVLHNVCGITCLMAFSNPENLMREELLEKST